MPGQLTTRQLRCLLKKKREKKKERERERERERVREREGGREGGGRGQPNKRRSQITLQYPSINREGERKKASLHRTTENNTIKSSEPL